MSDAAAVIVLVTRLEPDQAAVTLQLPLTAEQRSVLRGRRRTSCGREVVLQLPRDGALQPGDQLTDAQQSVLVEVQALVQDHLLVVLDVQDQIQYFQQLQVLVAEVEPQVMQIVHLMDPCQLKEQV